jgi:hypothetical protein
LIDKLASEPLVVDRSQTVPPDASCDTAAMSMLSVDPGGRAGPSTVTDCADEQGASASSAASPEPGPSGVVGFDPPQAAHNAPQVSQALGRIQTQ